MERVSSSSIPSNVFTVASKKQDPEAIKQAYTEFTRRVAILPLQVNQQKVNELCDAFQRGDWESEIYDDKDFPHYALKALEQGELTTEDVGTIQLYWTAIQAHGHDKVKAIDLRTPFAHGLIGLTVEASRGKGRLLTEEQEVSMFKAMKRKSKGQQVLFVIDGEKLSEIDDRALISDQIRKKTGINLFNKVDNVRLIPSAALMQEALNARFGDQAVKMNWVIGLSSAQDIYNNGRNGTRDVAVHFPGVDLPNIADKLSAPWYDFTYHDFYHSWLISSVPVKYRHLYLDMADAVQANTELAEEVKEAYWDRLIDMEVSNFRPIFDYKNDEQRFWHDLGQLAAKAGAVNVAAYTDQAHKAVAEIVVPIISAALGDTWEDLGEVRYDVGLWDTRLQNYARVASRARSRSPTGTANSGWRLTNSIASASANRV